MTPVRFPNHRRPASQNGRSWTNDPRKAGVPLRGGCHGSACSGKTARDTTTTSPVEVTGAM